ncbi:MAG: hypothetical protein M0Z38_05040 [Deltaproteobacteria bacterium]|nr:hypothetical protein [Deltaproteobacteria bacterium]
MKRISAFSVFVAALVVLSVAALSGPVLAEEKDNGDEGFPAYSVARLKVFEGTAWVRMPDSGEWEEFATNSPVPERSRVNIPEGSEAELQFHGGQFVLLTGGTEIDVRRFDDQVSAFRLRSGEIRFDLPPEDFSPVRVAIPGDGKTSFPVPGRYWLFVQEDGQTRLVVRSGEAAVKVERGDFRVKAGEAAMIGQEVRITAYGGGDEDNYASPPPLSEEERRVDAPPATVRELRDYGEWVNTTDYGYAWRPRVVVGWTPYYYGRWAWVSPFGWTWVSYEPWGWYPYHYGWWVTDPVFGWVWSPYRSFASVSITFGFGNFRHYHRGTHFYPGNVRFVREGGNVRWIPLRPGERFTRSGFTRSDPRLARWERPLERNAVFVRGVDNRGKREWRDWSAVRKDRRDVVVRARGERVGQPPPRPVARPRDGDSAVKRRPERVRPEKQIHVEPRPRPDRDKVVRPPEGRSTPEKRRPDPAPAVRPERDRSRRSGPESSIREEKVAPPPRPERVERATPPPPRVSTPPPRVSTPPPRAQERREVPGGRVPSPDVGSGKDGRGRDNPGERGDRGVGNRR